MDKHEPQVIGALVQRELELEQEARNETGFTGDDKAILSLAKVREELYEIHGYKISTVKSWNYLKRSLGDRMDMYDRKDP